MDEFVKGLWILIAKISVACLAVRILIELLQIYWRQE